jgi:hypothetical protein
MHRPPLPPGNIPGTHLCKRLSWPQGHWHNPSGHTMALESTQILTEMNTRNISWGKGGRCLGLTTLPPSCADWIKIWEPQPPGTIRAYQGLWWDCFTFYTRYREDIAERWNAKCDDREGGDVLQICFTLCYFLADLTVEEMTIRCAISSAVPEDLLRFTTQRTTGLSSYRSAHKLYTACVSRAEIKKNEKCRSWITWNQTACLPDIESFDQEVTPAPSVAVGVMIFYSLHLIGARFVAALYIVPRSSYDIPAESWFLWMRPPFPAQAFNIT